MFEGVGTSLMILGLLTLTRVDQLGVAEEDKHRMEKVWCLQLDEDEMVCLMCSLLVRRRR